MHGRTPLMHCGWIALAFALSTHAARIDIVGPPGSSSFGTAVSVLPNGNIVVTDPGAQADRGAVYLYSPAGVQISVIMGSVPGHRVGSGGITELANGNYVICSPRWNDLGTPNAGAMTWGSSSVGVSGVVSAANSLVGLGPPDANCASTLIPLANGNYAVCSPMWDKLDTPNVGAVTWGSGSVGVSGVVSAANSLVGTSPEDSVCSSGLFPLANGNYLVFSQWWDNGGMPNVGAVTWADGGSASPGAVTSANSLVGAVANEGIGFSVGVALVNGHYVLRSPHWDNEDAVDAGALTWIDGDNGISGVISPANSLVGTRTGDRVSFSFVTELSNGNFVTGSPYWSTGSAAQVGAVTWGNGAVPLTGEVSASNSLIGSSPGDRVGSRLITGLANGNYVVHTPNWKNGAFANAGSVTWGNGSTGTIGTVSPLNSLVGAKTDESVGFFPVRALTNGNYVLRVPGWDFDGKSDVGAVVWGNGNGGTSGEISALSSTIGTQASDQVGGSETIALSDGNYVILSPSWNNGEISSAGAATWRDGSQMSAGAVSSSNSLTSTKLFAWVGQGGAALHDGHYVILSPGWNDSVSAQSVGAVTWQHGGAPESGLVSAASSLVAARGCGSGGSPGITVLANGHFVVQSPTWDIEGSHTNVGAVGSSRVDLQACKLEYSIVSPK